MEIDVGVKFRIILNIIVLFYLSSNVPLFERISGDIGNVDGLFRYESINLPIDTLVVDLTRAGEEDDEFSESEFV